jgi:hypothetical protein
MTPAMSSGSPSLLREFLLSSVCCLSSILTRPLAKLGREEAWRNGVGSDVPWAELNSELSQEVVCGGFEGAVQDCTVVLATEKMMMMRERSRREPASSSKAASSRKRGGCSIPALSGFGIEAEHAIRTPELRHDAQFPAIARIMHHQQAATQEGMRHLD